MRVRKAVFPVAGLGTRFLPATKSMPKELMPILDKPLIHYAAEEAVKAGIDTLIFVTGRNKRAIEDYFDSNLELEAALEAKGKHAESAMVHNILPKDVECIFVRQPEQLGLGHAVLCAHRVVGDEPFAVFLADDFLVENGENTTAKLVQRFNETGKTQLSVMEVEGPAISQYGVVDIQPETQSVNAIVEKPKFEEAPSNLASIGRYVLTPDIFDLLKQIPKGSGGEIQLTDAIDRQAQKGNVEAVKLTATRFDCGSVQGYLDAILEQAKRSGYLP